jgi:hypothetical protein
MIEINPFTNEPNKAFDILKDKLIKEKVEPLDPQTPIFEDKVI